ncbi:MAG: HYR domain-containing protein [Ferruginibacter sp.]
MRKIQLPGAQSFSIRRMIAVTKKLFAVSALLVLFIIQASSQITPVSTECRTVVDPIEAKAHESNIAARLAAFTENFIKQRNEGISSLSTIVVPIVIHIVRMDNGSGGLPVATVRSEIINFVNTRYASIGVSFSECGAVNYINSTAYYNLSGDAEGNAMSVANNVANVLNIYFVNDPDGACGWARFPADLPSDYVVIANSCADNTSTLAHEIGHYFDLYHTHETAFGAECVNGSNCTTAGDLLCDTPADPTLTGNVTASPGCSYTGVGVDGCSSSPYNPSTHNIMSYSQKECRDIFTAQQNAKILFTIANGRNYLNYSCCVAPVISCPSGITVNNTTGQCGAVVNYTAATATGSEPLTITYSKASGSFFAVGTTAVTATATNSCGTSSCTFNVTVKDVQPPSITCPGNISVNNDEGVCGAVVTYTAPVGTDICPGAVTTRIAGLASGSTFPVGTTINTFKVTDAAGNIDMCSFNVTVTDNEKPVISAPAVLSCFEANNFGCSINLGATATDNCGMQSLTSDAPACFPVGTTTVTWTATDIHGNSSTTTQAVTRNPEININICAGITRTIYTGTYAGEGPFGPQSINLTSTVSGGSPGYTYSWSPTTGLSDPAIANPVASPTVTTNYVLTVTDSKGCTRSLAITINVLPLSAAVCYEKGKNVKFNVCHVPTEPPYTPNNICISANALPAHLIPGSTGHHNCTLGPCGQQLCFGTTSSSFQKEITSAEKIKVVEIIDGFRVFAYPNPTTSDFSIQVTSKSNEPVTVRLLDVTGVIKGVGMNNPKTNIIKVGADLPRGTYYAEVIQGTNRQMVKLIKN